MFTAPGLAEKAVKVATGTAATKIFFYTTLILWGLVRGQEYIASNTDFTTKSVTDTPYIALVLIGVLYYPTTAAVYEAFRRVFLVELSKAIGYVVDSPPTRPPMLWSVSKEYLAYQEKVDMRKVEDKPGVGSQVEGQSTTSQE